MPTIAFDLFFMVSSALDATTACLSSYFVHTMALIFEMEWSGLPFATCRAHMKHSAALIVAVSCVCLTHQAHRYPKRHPRRSMLLRQHARQRWLANCRSRSGSSLVQGRWREKRNRACAWLGLIPNSFPATTRQVSTECSVLPRRQLRMDGIPHHRTIALSRVSVFDGWPI